ncbi:MAG: sulfotransferase family protein [Ardenticatenaceae bacterium]
MKLIGAGFGRTGTLSIKHALEELGFGPCYHMIEVLENVEHIKLWQAIVDGQPANWQTIFGNYQATVDAPGCLYYKELMAQYPDAKVLLSVRDPERWYESVMRTVYQISLLPRWMEWLPKLGPFLRLTRMMLRDGSGATQGRFEERELIIEEFKRHNAEVQRIVPAEKLLVYSVKEGWEPLCHFLGVPVPDKPFPHVNDRAEMQQRINGMRRISRIIPATLAGVLALLLWWLVGSSNE